MEIQIEDLQKLAKKLPEVTEDIKWENHLCMCIDGKMFLIMSLDQQPTTSSIKVTDQEFSEMSEWDGFKPAEYLARYKWIWMDDINRLTLDQWEHLINQSYRLIASRLSKKRQQELGLIS